MTRTPVAKPLGLFLRGGIYALRVMVPQDLRPAFGGRSKIVESLGTADRSTADRLAAQRRLELLGQFEAKRRELNPQPLATVTPELSALLAQRVRAAVLAADEAVRGNPAAAVSVLALSHGITQATKPQPVRFLSDTPRPDPLPSYLHLRPGQTSLDGLTPMQTVALAEVNERLSMRSSQLLAGRRLSAVVDAVQGEARKLGIRFDPEAAGARDALAESLRAYRAAWADVQRRDRGEVVETPGGAPVEAATLPLAKPAATTHTLRDAFDSWRDSNPDRPRKTVDAYAAAVDRFDALMPGRHVEALGRADGLALVAALKRWADAEGKSRTTAAKILGQVKTLLAHAHNVEWIARNPLQGQSIEKAESDREPWSDDDLARLFNAPLFNAYELPSVARAGLDAAYWLPLLGLYTGARITELAQLWTDDVADTSDAGLVLTIREGKDRAQSLKNKASWRKVPVHSELVRKGFADYWRAIHSHGKGPLWPAVRVSQANGAGGKVSQWFGEFKTAQGFGATQTFHSFRHTVRTRLGALGLSELHINSLTGHAGKGEGQRTYTHLTPAHLRPTLERLEYPKLALRRVFTAPAWKPTK